MADVNIPFISNNIGKIGIGTDNPMELFHVSGIITASIVTASLFKGDLDGTSYLGISASWASSSITSSYTHRSQNAFFASQSRWAISASWASSSLTSTTSSYTHRAQGAFFASQSILAISASWASSSITSITSSYTYRAENAVFASQSRWATSASWSSASLLSTTSSYALSSSYAEIVSSFQTNTISASYASSSTSASIVETLAPNIINNGLNRLVTTTAGGSINAETNLTYDGNYLFIGTSNYNTQSIDSGSITTGLRMAAGEGFSIYGNQNFFGPDLDAIIFQMEDANNIGGITDGGFVFRGWSPNISGSNATASNWMTIKSGGSLGAGPNVGIGTMYPTFGATLHVFGNISASNFGSGSLQGTASYANRTNVASTSVFASQSRWAVSSSWASSSVTSVTTSYTHKAENSFFASQSIWAISASWTSESLTSTTSSYTHVAQNSFFASQSRWATSASWASSSLTSITSSYTHRAQNAFFASQSQWAVSASFASTSLNLLGTSYNISVTFASQSILATSASFASRSLTASYVENATPIFTGMSDNYLPKWSSNTLTGTSNVYDDGTNVGIGTNNPLYSLTIRESGNPSIIGLIVDDASINVVGLYLINNNTVEGSFRLDQSTDSPHSVVIEAGSGGSTYTAIKASGSAVLQLIPAGGLVGIGTSFPESTLHIFGHVSASNFGSGSFHGTALYSSQSRWSISASWASSSIISTTSSYTHRAQNTFFASQSRWATSASFASSSITSSGIIGGSSGFVSRWLNNTTLTTSSIQDSVNLVTVTRNLKVTGSIYKDTQLLSIPHATHNNQWLRIAQFNSNDTNIDNLGGWMGIGKFRIIANPNASVGASNCGNWADVSLINAGYGNSPTIVIENAFSYSNPIATKIRSGKDGGGATWFVDVYLENISSSATLDQLQISCLDGRIKLLNEISPLLEGTSSVEFPITYPSVYSSTNLTYTYRVEGKTLLSGSSPLTLLGLNNGSDISLLTVDNVTGLVKTTNTASFATTSSWAYNLFGGSTFNASHSFFSSQSLWTISASWASKSINSDISISSSYASASSNLTRTAYNISVTFASQSVWSISASWASSSLTSSYTHRSQNAFFASQSRWAVSASWASSSLSASYAPFTQTYQFNTISSSWSSKSYFSDTAGDANTLGGFNSTYFQPYLITGDTYLITSSFARTSSKIIGGTDNYITKWSDSTTLTSSNIIDDNTLVTVLKNIKHTGSLYKDTFTLTIPEATYNNKWVRIAAYNDLENSLDLTGGYLTSAKLKIIVVPSISVGSSNRGNYADVNIINSGFSNQASVVVTNAYTYNSAVVTKIRTSKSGSAATWFVDVYLENISSSAVNDKLQIISEGGKISLLNQINPITGSSVSETPVLTPTYHISNNSEFGLRIEGNGLLISSSTDPLKLIGIQSSNNLEFLSINSQGIINKGSIIPTASISISASYYPQQIYQVNTVSSSWASSSLSSSYTHRAQNTFFASQSRWATSASFASSSITSSYSLRAQSLNSNYVASINADTSNFSITNGGPGEGSQPTISLQNQISVTGITSSVFGTSSWSIKSINSVFASQSLWSVSASWASSSLTASYVASAIPIFTGNTNNYIPKWSSNTLTGTSLVYDNGTSVGIGTTSITGSLHVYNAVTNIPILNLGGGTYNINDLYVLNSNQTSSGVGYAAKIIGVNISASLTSDNFPIQRTTFGGITSATAIVLSADDPAIGNQDNAFQIWTSNGGNAGTVLTQSFCLTSTGFVGIATSLPQSRLHIHRSSGSSIITIENTGNGFTSGLDFYRERQTGAGIHGSSIFINSDTGSNNSFFYIQSQTAGANAGITSSLSDANGVRLLLRGGTGEFSIENGSVETLRLTSTNRVGIGYTNPDSTLYVTGSSTAATNILNLKKGSPNGTQNFIVAYHDNGNSSFGLSSDLNKHTGLTMAFNGTTNVNLSTFWSTYINPTNYNNGGGLTIGSTTLSHGYGLYVSSGSISGSAYFSDNVGIGVLKPQYRLHLVDNTTDWVSFVYNPNNTAAIYLAGGLGYGMYVDCGTNAGSSTYALNVNKNGTTYLEIRGDGYIGINAAPSTTGQVYINSTNTSTAHLSLASGITNTNASNTYTFRGWWGIYFTSPSYGPGTGLYYIQIYS